MSEQDPETNQTPDAGESGTAEDSLTKDDYSLGTTSDPEGAQREEPAGEDYAGSGF